VKAGVDGDVIIRQSPTRVKVEVVMEDGVVKRRDADDDWQIQVAAPNHQQVSIGLVRWLHLNGAGSSRLPLYGT
jgi:hypothetical protein